MNKTLSLRIVTCALIVGVISACQSTEELVDVNQPTEESVEVVEAGQSTEASLEDSADVEQPTDASADPSSSPGELVEVRLSDDVDEPRGYCLDIAGGRGANAPIEKGLQAHTCYDYAGSLLEDQSFDSALIEQGQFKIPYFDVCMTASSPEAGSTLMLATCESGETQQFSLEPNGNLTLQAQPELCVTVSSTEKKEGRGGTPAHVMRPLSLQPCSADNVAYQGWSIFRL